MGDGPISLEGTEFGELDYFVVQAAFTQEGIEISFAEEQFTSEDAALVSTIAVRLGEDGTLNRCVMQAQVALNEMVVRAYQIMRDAKA